MPEHDERLIEQFRTEGQIDALNELLSRHLASVRRVVASMLLDQDAADDVTQEVFLRVVRGIESFDGRASFSTWMFRIAMNAARSFLDRRSRSPMEYRTETVTELETSPRSGERDVLNSELSEQIRSGLEQLTPTLRAAIVLTGLQGLDAAEAAQIEDCSIDTMYWRVHEARRRMKELLKEYLS